MGIKSPLSTQVEQRQHYILIRSVHTDASTEDDELSQSAVHGISMLHNCPFDPQLSLLVTSVLTVLFWIFYLYIIPRF